jgi:IS5 family transposase
MHEDRRVYKAPQGGTKGGAGHKGASGARVHMVVGATNVHRWRVLQPRLAGRTNPAKGYRPGTS